MAEPASGAVHGRRMLSGALLLLMARFSAMGMGLLQAILLARKFGATTTTDAFFVAQSVAFLFIGAVEASMNIAFTPVFVHMREEEGEEQAWRLAAGMYRIGLVGLSGFSLLLALLAPWVTRIMAPGFDAEARHLTVQMTRLLSLTVPFLYTAAFLASLDFIGQRYWTPALAMVVHAIAGPLALWLGAARFGIYALGYGVLAGSILRCLLQGLAFPAKRRLMGEALTLRDPAMRRLGQMVGVRLLTNWFFDLNLMVDRCFASLLGPGSVSALAYASRAVLTVARVTIMPLGRVMIPVLSQLAAKRDYARMRSLAEKMVMVLWLVVLPAVAFMMGYRREVLAFVFRHGQFTPEALDATASALFYFGLGMVPFLLNPLLNGMFFATQDSRTPLRVGFITSVANAGLDVVLMQFMGNAGIALSTSLVSLIRAILLWYYLVPRIGALDSRLVLRSMLLSSLFASLAVWVALLAEKLPLAHIWTVHHVLRLTVAAGVLLTVYLALQALINRPLLRVVRQLVQRGRAT